MNKSSDEQLSSTSSGRILVVDDDAAHREALAKVLTRAGYVTGCAADGKEAIRHLEVASWDLVLTDLLMPHLGGLPLLREIRRAYPRTPVVIVTAYGEWKSYVEAVELGAVEYLSKPVKRDVLVATVRRALGQKGDEKASHGQV